MSDYGYEQALAAVRKVERNPSSDYLREPPAGLFLDLVDAARWANYAERTERAEMLKTRIRRCLGIPPIPRLQSHEQEGTV